MKLMVLLLVLSVISFLSVFCENSFTQEEYVRAFDQWRNEHRKVYDEHEAKYRLRIFKNNMDFVLGHNQSGKHTFKVGLNRFADLTNTEFRERYTGFHHRLVAVHNPKHAFDYDSSLVLPYSVDWRDKGVVTGVKDQGSCGSCWSFSTTGSVEGAWALNYSLVSLSEQNLMDCSRRYGNLGCNGGLMDNAFEYIIDNDGIDTEESYPYEESTDFECAYKVVNRGAQISDYKDVTSGSEEALQTAVAYRGPVSVAIDAGHLSFQLYDEGVYYEERCSDSELDHGVLAVGYGLSTDGEYWIVKNSWGTSWGEDGYIRMARNQDNNCGIATQASFPIV